ncbi:MAG: hypothetical protein HC883_00245 [Bdellovibrionaceae bacterium]|nr:hypothetical protein [Pseudobdellovibrionaceae bacterium]
MSEEIESEEIESEESTELPQEIPRLSYNEDVEADFDSPGGQVVTYRGKFQFYINLGHSFDSSAVIRIDPQGSILVAAKKVRRIS